jgi:hypothetical protein
MYSFLKRELFLFEFFFFVKELFHFLEFLKKGISKGLTGLAMALL